MKLKYKLCLVITLLLTTQLSIANISTNKTLAFFVGHSQWNKGSKGKDLPHEWDYCKAVGDEIVKLAPQYGIDVKVFYRGPGDYRQAVYRMHEAKNQWSPQAPVISCHYNETPEFFNNVQKHAARILALFANGASPKKGSLFGTLVLYKPTPATKQVASCLLQNVEALMQRPTTTSFINVSSIIPIVPIDRGAEEILAPMTTSPVLILEIGYGDNPIDSKIMLAPNFKSNLAAIILQTYQNNQCNPNN